MHSSIERSRNVPQLRFPEFEGIWQKKALLEVTEKITDGTHDTPKPVEKGIPYLTAIHIKDGFVDYENCYFVTKEVHDVIYKRCNPEKDDLLIVNIGAGTATCALNTVDYEFSMKNVALVKPNKNIISGKYLAQFQRAKSEKIFNQLTSGGAQPFLSLKEIGKLEISFPSLKEQTKIASFHTVVDEKIQALKKKHSLLEQYKKGVMQKLFSQELRFKDENGNDFPEWEEKFLGDVLIKNSTKNKNQKYSLVQSVSNKHGIINQDEMFEDRRVASKDTSNYYVIEKGHFAYNPSRIDVGSLAYKYDDKISVISPLYISFRANHKYVSDAYLLNWFSSEQFIKQMNGSFEGSVRNTLSYESLIKMSISLPKEKEQDKIASFLIEIDNRMRISENEILKLESWKKGLLQKMFC